MHHKKNHGECFLCDNTEIEDLRYYQVGPDTVQLCIRCRNQKNLYKKIRSIIDGRKTNPVPD